MSWDCWWERRTGREHLLPTGQAPLLKSYRVFHIVTKKILKKVKLVKNKLFAKWAHWRAVLCRELTLQLPTHLWSALPFTEKLVWTWWIWECWCSQAGSFCPFQSSFNQCYSRFCASGSEDMRCSHCAVKYCSCWGCGLVPLQAFGQAGRRARARSDAKTSLKTITYKQRAIVMFPRWWGCPWGLNRATPVGCRL